MSFSSEGMDQLKLQLRRLEGLPAITSQEMKACAEDVRQLARDMAPIEYGDLKKAIQIRRTAAQGAGGRLTGLSNYEVFINNNYRVNEHKDVEGVGEYAWMVHEHMGYGSTPGSILVHGKPFMPSEASVKAGLERGVEAGGLFMERAAKALQAQIHARLARVAYKYIEALDN